MQTRWAWWAYNFDSAVIPAAGPVGAVQYNGDPYLAGEAAFAYDDVTNILSVPRIQLDALPVLSGFAYNDDQNQDTLLIKPGSGVIASMMLASSFASDTSFKGLFFKINSSAAATIASYIDGAGSTSSLQLIAGSNGLTLRAIGGTVNLFNSMVVSDGQAIQTETTDAYTMKFGVYDVNGAAYRYPIVFTNGNAPDLTISVPTTGTTNITATSLTVAGDGGGVAAMTQFTSAVDTTLTNVLVVKGAAAGATPNIGMLKVYVGTTAYGVPYFPLA